VIRLEIPSPQQDWSEGICTPRSTTAVKES
jgi:hypothetical protein